MNIYLILDVVILILGLYVVYASFKMKSTGKIAGSFLAEEDQKKVKDQKGYIDYIENKSCASRSVYRSSCGGIGAVRTCLKDSILEIYRNGAFVIAIIFFHMFYEIQEKNL